MKHDEDGSFALNAKINLLADGSTEADRASQIVARHLQTLSEISWPSDFGVLLGGEVAASAEPHVKSSGHDRQRGSELPDIVYPRRQVLEPDRIDNVHGDRNLICTCPPLSDYQDAAE